MLKDSEDRRAIRSSSGQPQEEDITEIIPDLVEEAIPDQIIVPDKTAIRDHTETRVGLGANQGIEAEALEMESGIEKSRLRDQRVI